MTRLRSAAARSTDESEQSMQFGIIPPVRTGVTADPAWMTSFARHAEACGFESVVLVEHAVVVSDYQSTYPYASSGKMPLPDDCRIPDPLDLMAYLAAVTDTITLATGVLVAPNHQAVVLAKRIATVDVLSRGTGPHVPRGRVDGRGAAGPPGPTPVAGDAAPTRPSPPCGPCGPTAGPDGADFDGRVRLVPPRPLVPQAGAAGRRPHPHRRPQRRPPPDGPAGSATGSSPSGSTHELLDHPLGPAAARRPRRRAATPAPIELSLSGYLPTTTEHDVDRGRGARGTPAGGVHLHVRRPVEIDDELSAFAERFGLQPPDRP